MITPIQAFQNWLKSTEKENYVPPTDDSKLPEEFRRKHNDKEVIITLLDFSRSGESKNVDYQFKIKCDQYTKSITVTALNPDKNLAFSMEEYNEEEFNFKFTSLVEKSTLFNNKYDELQVYSSMRHQITTLEKMQKRLEYAKIDTTDLQTIIQQLKTIRKNLFLEDMIENLHKLEENN